MKKFIKIQQSEWPGRSNTKMMEGKGSGGGKGVRLWI
jgi:hypothetical protein